MVDPSQPASQLSRPNDHSDDDDDDMHWANNYAAVYREGKRLTLELKLFFRSITL